VADYWVETVSTKSKYIPEAWDFVQFATSVPDNAKMYLEQTKKPTALRTLINGQVDDNDIGVFASQLLTAVSWYTGKNYAVAEQVMAEMLDGIAASPERLEIEARIAAGKLKQTLY